MEKLFLKFTILIAILFTTHQSLHTQSALDKKSKQHPLPHAHRKKTPSKKNKLAKRMKPRKGKSPSPINLGLEFLDPAFDTQSSSTPLNATPPWEELTFTLGYMQRTGLMGAQEPVINLSGVALGDFNDEGLTRLFINFYDYRESTEALALDNNNFGNCSSKNLFMIATWLKNNFNNLKYLSLKNNSLNDLFEIRNLLEELLEADPSYANSFPANALPHQPSFISICRQLSGCKKLESIDFSNNEFSESHKHHIRQALGKRITPIF